MCVCGMVLCHVVWCVCVRSCGGGGGVSVFVLLFVYGQMVDVTVGLFCVGLFCVCRSVQCTQNTHPQRA